MYLIFFQLMLARTLQPYVSNARVRTVLEQKHDAALPWLIDLISIVLGMRSSAVPMTDFRLTLDLKRVFISVDLPKPL